MPKITPHLWFDKEAEEAARFYASIFKESKIKNISSIKNTPSGDVTMLTADLSGQDFMMISAGPYFKFTPSVSFRIACDTEEEAASFWRKLGAGGSVLMDLGAYPFSKKYGWLRDRYGLSWQVMSKDGRDIKQKITPVLMFSGDVCGRAEEAINFYVSVFQQAKIGDIARYESGDKPDKEGTVKHASFVLEGEEFAAMDSARVPDSKFNEAISFVVTCADQKEIDYFWNKLSADPKAEQCGWLKDKYGLSWQIVPVIMDKMMADQDEKKRARVTEAFLKMKKFDIAALERAYEGK